MNLETVDEDLQEKIKYNLDRFGLDWEELSESQQEQILEGSKALEQEITSRLS